MGAIVKFSPLKLVTNASIMGHFHLEVVVLISFSLFLPTILVVLLAFLHLLVSRDIPINIPQAIDEFALMHSRRMEMIDILSDIEKDN